jgi:threonine/homoserine/homoserine lactone efflux protein
VGLEFRGGYGQNGAMDPTAALIAGLIAGIAIAMQVGAVSLLLVEAAVVAGPRAGVAAGMGVATADFGFAAVAAAAGGAAGAALASHETEIRIVAALVLAAIALHGLVAVVRESAGAAPGAVTAGGVRAHYARFLAITAANPLTIASFAAVAAALTLDGPVAAVAFTAGVGAASAGWHLVLSLAAGHAGRWITPGIRRGLAIGGRLLVLAIAAHLALG